MDHTRFAGAWTSTKNHFGRGGGERSALGCAVEYLGAGFPTTQLRSTNCVSASRVPQAVGV